ncbi:class I SAM-dependent methyltransferase [Alkalihalobacterium chitinilyticum]|uniref:Class I SAM-dependent methyltransferase n=1 Tax=Alkalihalobacterium chitinilyticum TaxID=2980103 RepID=A0ABT5VLQ0_9BACI|nr:class I SAM-dependent methyltransferase [Alkalihalobacterium chitinilyticum]MDE5415408.1 class I SAM-dependent methyltransferase [Alkalihalobacterium chitinilyticum]
MNIDFGLTANDYSKYRVQYPDKLFIKLQNWGVGIKGQSLLDIGTGTGFLGRKFAEKGLEVTGVDISEELLNEARILDQEYGLKINYVNSKAEKLPFDDNHFDIVTAAQCWHWFNSTEVLHEIKRVLKEDGKLIILHLDWLPIKDNVVSKTEELILLYNPKWTGDGGNGMYPAWLTQVSEAGYRNIETFTFDLDVNFSHDTWRGRVRASAGVGASLTESSVKNFDADLQKLLKDEFQENLIIPHRIFCLVCTRPNT